MNCSCIGLRTFRYLSTTIDTSAVYYVALYVAYQTLVAVAVDEYLQIHHIPQFLVQKSHYALDYNHRLWLHMHRLGQTVALQIGVSGLFDGTSLAQFVDMPYKEFPVESVGMVEVDGVSLLLGHVRRVVVIRVERHDGDMMRRQRLHNLPHYCGLAGTGSSGYSYNRYFIHKI